MGHFDRHETAWVGTSGGHGVIGEGEGISLWRDKRTGKIVFDLCADNRTTMSLDRRQCKRLIGLLREMEKINYE